MPEDGKKQMVSTDDLNEVRTSLESSIDTKMSKMDSKLDQLTALLNSVTSKVIPTEVVEEVEDPY